MGTSGWGRTDDAGRWRRGGGRPAAPGRPTGLRASATLGVVAALLVGCGAQVAGVAARGASPTTASAAPVTPPTPPGDPGSTAAGATPTASRASERTTSVPATTSLPTTSSRAPATTAPRTTSPRPTATSPTTSRSTTSRPAPTDAVEATLGDSGAIEVGSPTAKIVIDVYEEPMCPPCATFSARYGAEIGAAALSGKVKVRFRIANFLDGTSHSKNYSTRAIAALLTTLAYDRNPRTLLSVQDAIFDDRNQPVEGADEDLTDAQLAALAEEHGAGAESVAAIRKGLVRPSAEATARLTRSFMVAQKVTAVPWVQVGGRTVDLDDPRWLTKALTG